MSSRRPSPVLFLLAALALSSCTRGGLGRVRSPTFDYARQTEGGCNDLFFHKGTADRLEVLWISADRKKLNLPEEGGKTFDLAAAPDGLLVAVDLWETAPRFSAYCNDISPDTKREATWRATKGRLTIAVRRPPGDPKSGSRTFRADARLEDVVFEDGAGHQATLKEETIADVMVGWFAG